MKVCASQPTSVLCRSVGQRSSRFPIYPGLVRGLLLVLQSNLDDICMASWRVGIGLYRRRKMLQQAQSGHTADVYPIQECLAVSTCVRWMIGARSPTLVSKRVDQYLNCL